MVSRWALGDRSLLRWRPAAGSVVGWRCTGSAFLLLRLPHSVTSGSSPHLSGLLFSSALPTQTCEENLKACHLCVFQDPSHGCSVNGSCVSISVRIGWIELSSLRLELILVGITSNSHQSLGPDVEGVDKLPGLWHVAPQLLLPCTGCPQPLSWFLTWSTLQRDPLLTNSLKTPSHSMWILNAWTGQSNSFPFKK